MRFFLRFASNSNGAISFFENKQKHTNVKWVNALMAFSSRKTTFFRTVNRNEDIWIGICRFMDSKTLLALQNTCVFFKILVEEYFTSYPVHCVKFLGIYWRENKIEFRDSKRNKLFLENNHFPLPKYILFEFFHLNLGQQCVQNFIINGGLGEFTNSIRGSSLSMMFSLILFPTRQKLIQFIRMYLLDAIKISSNFKMWGSHLPLFTINEENASHENLFLSSLFYEIRSLEITFYFEDSLHVKNFTEQWNKEVSTSTLVPCPDPYGELAISIHIDEIFDWLVRKGPMDDGSGISRVLQVYAECLSFNCADQMNYINILIENLKENFLNSPVKMDSYVLEIKHHFLSQKLPPHFELYNRFNQQLTLMTTEEERNRTSTMLIIIRHT